MKCKICGKECKGQCCSARCRAKLSRQKAHDKRTRTVFTETMEHKRTVKEHTVRLTVKLLAELPDAVVKPTVQPTEYTASLTAWELQTMIDLMPGTDWMDSPEYAEVIYRLLTMSIEELEVEGQSIPNWKYQKKVA